jgi:hypothetical protein
MDLEMRFGRTILAQPQGNPRAGAAPGHPQCSQRRIADGLAIPDLGLATFQPWPTALGMVLITGARLWYIDRMAVLYDDMGQRLSATPLSRVAISRDSRHSEI